MLVMVVVLLFEFMCVNYDSFVLMLLVVVGLFVVYWFV